MRVSINSDNIIFRSLHTCMYIHDDDNHQRMGFQTTMYVQLAYTPHDVVTKRNVKPNRPWRTV